MGQNGKLTQLIRDMKKWMMLQKFWLGTEKSNFVFILTQIILDKKFQFIH
jgi:hypothetical protein